MKIPDHVRRGWEHRFPDLSEEWTHWQIEGDGQILGLINGANLIDALNIVKMNFGKFVSIKACLAKVATDGEIIVQENRNFEISRYDYDSRDCKDVDKNEP